MVRGESLGSRFGTRVQRRLGLQRDTLQTDWRLHVHRAAALSTERPIPGHARGTDLFACVSCCGEDTRAPRAPVPAPLAACAKGLSLKKYVWFNTKGFGPNCAHPGFGPIDPHHAILRQGTPRTRGRTGHGPPPSRYDRARCALLCREGFSRIGRSSRKQRVP